MYIITVLYILTAGRRHWLLRIDPVRIVHFHVTLTRQSRPPLESQCLYGRMATYAVSAEHHPFKS